MSEYKQCRLEKRKGILLTYCISWIPVKYAKLNKVVKIKSSEGWEDGWKVTKVFHFTRDSEYMHILQTQHIKQRDISDI